MSPKTISVAYSPDTDDAFMVEALKQNKIDTSPYSFEFFSEDIQVLNEAARTAKYDITAISVAAYPYIEKDYWLTDYGASVGNQFGPKVVVRQDLKITIGSSADSQPMLGKKIAIPGKMTTAYLAARDLLGIFEAIPMYFKDIIPAVLSGEVDGGILIHEAQLHPENSGLQTYMDLGLAWYQKYSLPLPLGANAIKKNLGQSTIVALNHIYRRSIEWALAHRTEALGFALINSGAGIDMEAAHKYISMYVNDDSLSFRREVKEAIRKLFNIGVQAGFYPKLSADPFAFNA